MALNLRQSIFLSKLQMSCNKMQIAYQEAKELKEHFDEEFSNGQDNSLNDAGIVDDLDNMGLDYSSISACSSQGFTNYINFWEGTAVPTREYGKDVRRIAR